MGGALWDRRVKGPGSGRQKRIRTLNTYQKRKEEENTNSPGNIFTVTPACCLIFRSVYVCWTVLIHSSIVQHEVCRKICAVYDLNSFSVL